MANSENTKTESLSRQKGGGPWQLFGGKKHLQVQQVKGGTTTVASWPLEEDIPPNTAVMVEVTAIGISVSGGDVGAYRLLATFRRLGGGLDQVGTTTKLVEHETNAGWDASVQASGNRLEVKVTSGSGAYWHLDASVRFVRKSEE